MCVCVCVCVCVRARVCVHSMNIQCMSAQTHLFQDHLLGLGWQLAALVAAFHLTAGRLTFHLTVRAVRQLLFSYLTEVASGSSRGQQRFM